MTILGLISGTLLAVGVLLFIAKYAFAYEQVGDLPFYFFVPGLLLQLLDSLVKPLARRSKEEPNG